MGDEKSSTGKRPGSHTKATRQHLFWMRTVLCLILYLHDIAPSAVCARLGIDDDDFASVINGEAELTSAHVNTILDLAGITTRSFYNAVFQLGAPGAPPVKVPS